MFDLLTDVPLTHDSQVKLWDCNMDTIESVDGQVPPLKGVEGKYLVQLQPSQGLDSEPVYLYVDGNTTRGILHSHEIPDDLKSCPIVDKFGDILGGSFRGPHGVVFLEEGVREPGEAFSIREDTFPPVTIRRVDFPIRGDQNVTLHIPADLTTDEKNRLVNLVLALPSQD